MRRAERLYDAAVAAGGHAHGHETAAQTVHGRHHTVSVVKARQRPPPRDTRSSHCRCLLFRWLKRMLRRGCCSCCPSSKVEEGAAKKRQIEDYLDYERQKEPLGDFTLSEYNEKGEAGHIGR